MQTILTVGSDWPMIELSNKLRKLDVEEALAFVNHKGAADKPGLFRSPIETDVSHGYGVVIPLNNIKITPGFFSPQ